MSVSSVTSAHTAPPSSAKAANPPPKAPPVNVEQQKVAQPQHAPAPDTSRQIKGAHVDIMA